MPNVTGRIVKPSGTAGGPANGTRVRFRLVDSAGNHVRQAWDTGTANRVIVDQEDFGLDAEGDYTVTLAPNTQIEPSGTRWQRIILDGPNEGPALSMVVPVGGGPYNEHTIRDDVLDALPTPQPSNEVDSFSPTANSANIAVTGFTLVPVPNFVVDVPDLDQPCLFFGTINVRHATTANAILYAGIAAEGVTSLTSAKGLGTARAGTAGVAVSVPFIGRVPAHSPGAYQVGVNGDSGNLVVVGGDNNISICEVLAV